MVLHDGLSDCQSHSCALDHHSLVPSSIELLKDHLLFDLVDAGTVIRNADYLLCTLQLDCDVNRSVRGRVFAGIIEQLGNHLGNSFQIHPHRRQIGGNVQFHSMLP